MRPDLSRDPEVERAWQEINKQEAAKQQRKAEALAASNGQVEEKPEREPVAPEPEPEPSRRKRTPIEPTLGDIALAYAAKGIPVFPTHGIVDGACTCGKSNCTSSGKHPDGKLAPNGFKNATTDLDQIRSWWAQRPNANIGIPTGAITGLAVLDIDDPQGLPELERRYGKLSATREHRTGSDHVQWVYQHPGPGTRIWTGAAFDGIVGIDARGDGGYIVAPGSRGRRCRYAVLNDIKLAALPEKWIAALTVKPRTPVPAAQSPNGTRIPKGQRQERLFKLASGMRRHGADQEVILAALRSVRDRQCEEPESVSEDQLADIARRVERNYQPAPASEIEKPPVTLDRASTVEAGPVTWQIDGWVPAGMLTLLSGMEGIGKSLLALHMAEAVLFGTKFLGGWSAQQGKVAALLMDDAAVITVERIQRLGLRDHAGFFLATPDQVNIKDPVAFIEYVRELLVERNVKLLIIDALYLLTPTSRDAGNDVARMAPIMQALNQLAERTGAAVVLLAHDRKAKDDVAGSFVIRAAPKLLMRLALPKGELEPEDSDDVISTTERVLRLEKNKLGVSGAWRLQLRYPRWRVWGTVKDMRARDRERHLLDAVRKNPESTAEDLARMIKRRTADVRNDLARLTGREVEMREVPASEHGGRPSRVYTVKHEPREPVR